MPLESVGRLILAHRDRARRATERWVHEPSHRAQSEAAWRLNAARSLHPSLTLTHRDLKPIPIG